MAYSSTSRKYSYDKHIRNIGILILKMILLLSLAVGSTVAIFTSRDENTIRVGAAEMDMKLYRMVDGVDSDYVEITGAEGDAFSGILWEPGATRLVSFKVVNGGDIPVKYVLRFVADMGDLAGAMEFLSFEGGAELMRQKKSADWEELKAEYAAEPLESNIEDLDFGEELKKMQTSNRISGKTPVKLSFHPGENVDYFVVAIHMNAGAGNAFQGKSCSVTVKLYAEQGNI